MFKFYRDLFREFPELFREKKEWADFWWAMIGPPVVSFLALVIPISAQTSGRIAAVSTGVWVFYLLLRANYRRYTRLQDQVKELRAAPPKIIDELGRLCLAGRLVVHRQLDQGNDEQFTKWKADVEVWRKQLVAKVTEFLAPHEISRVIFVTWKAAPYQKQISKEHGELWHERRRQLEVLEEIIGEKERLYRSQKLVT